MTDGVLVGCDVKQEWMLQWWWENYSQDNSYPVAFADFGMSPEALTWCKAHGTLLTCTPENLHVLDKGQLDPRNVQIWENSYDLNVWEARKSWFQKPFACLNSPFDRTIWIDLDCEIIGPLAPLFEKCHNAAGLAAAQEVDHAQIDWREQNQAFANEIVYNSGVVVFAKNSPLIARWAHAALTNNQQFMGDQDILNRLIYLGGFQITELDQIYNWRMSQGLNLNAVIIHWVRKGKEYIRQYGGIGKEIKAFIQHLSRM